MDSEFGKNRKNFSPAEFQRLAEQGQPNIIREMFDFLLYYKKWWLAPIIVGLLMAGAVVILGSSSMAPLIYTLF